jgi:flagellar hook-associated protein 2
MNMANVSGNSGIDSLVSQYMAIERKPLDQLEQQKQDITIKKSIYTDLKSKLSALRTAASNLKQTGADSLLSNKTISSSNEDILKATSTSDAKKGNHLVKVLQIAKADTIISDEINLKASNLSGYAGKGETSFKINVNGVSTEIKLNISNDGKDDSSILSQIAAAINDSKAEVTATVVNVGNNKAKLVLQSDNTGTSSRISLTDGSGSILSKIGLLNSTKVDKNKGAGGHVYDETELSAHLEVDGIDVTSESNVVDDVITGVTLNLAATQKQTDDPIQLTIDADDETIKTNLKAFFEKYNDVVNYLREKISVDPTAKTRGALAGDSTFSNLWMNLRSTISGEVSSVSTGNATRITDVGIEPDDKGNLSIKDSDKFTNALDEKMSNIADLFSSEKGIAVKIYDSLTSLTSSGGVIDDSNDLLNRRVKSINNRISNLEKQLQIKENNYRQQMAKLQQAYAALSNQQNIISVVNSSLSMFNQ